MVYPKHPVIDDLSKSCKTISVEEGDINEKRHWFVKTVVDITGANTKVHFKFDVPNVLFRHNAYFALSAEAEFSVKIIRGSTYTDDGTEITPQANDQESTTEPTLVAYSAPTIDVLGSTIWEARTGAGRASTGVITGLNYKIIPLRGSNYLFEIEKLATGTDYVDINFWWSETACASLYGG